MFRWVLCLSKHLLSGWINLLSVCWGTHLRTPPWPSAAEKPPATAWKDNDFSPPPPSLLMPPIGQMEQEGCWQRMLGSAVWGPAPQEGLEEGRVGMEMISRKISCLSPLDCSMHSHPSTPFHDLQLQPPAPTCMITLLDMKHPDSFQRRKTLSPTRHFLQLWVMRILPVSLPSHLDILLTEKTLMI